MSDRIVRHGQSDVHGISNNSTLHPLIVAVMLSVIYKNAQQVFVHGGFNARSVE